MPSRVDLINPTLELMERLSGYANEPKVVSISGRVSGSWHLSDPRGRKHR